MPSTFDRDATHFSGSKQGESVSWAKLTVSKSVKPCTYSTLVLHRVSLLYTQGGSLDPRKISSIFSTLKTDGNVWLPEKAVKNGAYPDVEDFLKRSKYEKNTDIGIESVNGVPRNYTIYSKRVRRKRGGWGTEENGAYGSWVRYCSYQTKD